MPPKRKAFLSRYLLKSQILKAAKRRIQEAVSSMRLLAAHRPIHPCAKREIVT